MQNEKRRRWASAPFFFFRRAFLGDLLLPRSRIRAGKFIDLSFSVAGIEGGQSNEVIIPCFYAAFPGK